VDSKNVHHSPKKKHTILTRLFSRLHRRLYAQHAASRLRCSPRLPPHGSSARRVQVSAAAFALSLSPYEADLEPAPPLHASFPFFGVFLTSNPVSRTRSRPAAAVHTVAMPIYTFYIYARPPHRFHVFNMEHCIHPRFLSSLSPLASPLVQPFCSRDAPLPTLLPPPPYRPGMPPPGMPPPGEAP
jgi:hypothetical protein